MPKYDVPKRVEVSTAGTGQIHTLLEHQLWLTGTDALPVGDLVDVRFATRTEPWLEARYEVVQSSHHATGLELTGATVESVREAIREWSLGLPALVLSTQDLSAHHPAVLVVEDDAQVSALLVRVLKVRRHTVLSARTADVARKLIDTREVGAILLDWMLPGESGETVLQHAKEHHPSVRVAVVSGVASLKATQREIERLGADAVFVKPFSIAAVSRWVADALAGAR
jgi:CheY-like chemotaxis protein